MKISKVTDYAALKKHPLATELIFFHGNLPPKTGKLITLTNYSRYFSPIVPVKVSGYTRNILCYVIAGDNSVIKPAFTNYGAKTHQVFR